MCLYYFFFSFQSRMGLLSGSQAAWTNITQGPADQREEEPLESKESWLLILSSFSCSQCLFFHFLKVCAGDQQVRGINCSIWGCLLKCSWRAEHDALKKQKKKSNGFFTFPREQFPHTPFFFSALETVSLPFYSVRYTVCASVHIFWTSDALLHIQISHRQMHILIYTSYINPVTWWL